MIVRTIAAKEIEKYMPHRPPMVWIDDVLEFSEKAGTCRVVLKMDAHYMDESGLRASACLEFIAQAHGFISVCHHIYVLNPDSKPLSKAYLASFKDARLASPEILRTLRTGDELQVYIEGVRTMGQIVMFTGRVKRGDLLLCEAQLKTFKEYSE